MFFNFMPREYRFFDMFDEATAILTRASNKFLIMLTQFDNLTERCEEMKREENACDEVVEKIIKALDRSFITPFDREDIHSLAVRLDDVLDNMEESAHRFEIFRVEKPTTSAVALARIIHECCVHIEQAVRLCRNLKDVEEIHKNLLEIGRLENEADSIYRETDKSLFANPTDLLQLIKWRELYGWLEETVDACKDVAMIISEVVIKES
ncbi:MAG: DUF47 domain-containing protein [Gemmataceae bacterium]